MAVAEELVQAGRLNRAIQDSGIFSCEVLDPRDNYNFSETSPLRCSETTVLSLSLSLSLIASLSCLGTDIHLLNVECVRTQSMH
jgi:hypothetical protein